MNDQAPPLAFGLSAETLATMQLTPTPEPSLVDLGKRLSGYRSTTLQMSEAVAADAPFADYADFKARALRTIERPVREYDIVNHDVKLVVPESYAVELDAVRRLRLRAAESCLEHDDRLSDPLSAEDARAMLSQHPLRQRILPEELVVHLDELPDARYLSRIVLSPEDNPEDRWTKLEYRADWFVSAMATEPNGDVLLFKTERNEFVRVNLFHEWTHRLQKQADESYQVFLDAIELGWRKYVPRSYALRSYGEHWAVVGEELLHVDARRFLEVASNSPIRTVIMMLALEQSLQSNPKPGCPFAPALAARIGLVRGPVLAKARESLAAFLAEAGSDNQSRACRITLFLNRRLAQAAV